MAKCTPSLEKRRGADHLIMHKFDYDSPLFSREGLGESS
jgi:hypothetical protein